MFDRLSRRVKGRVMGRVTDQKVDQDGFPVTKMFNSHDTAFILQFGSRIDLYSEKYQFCL